MKDDDESDPLGGDYDDPVYDEYFNMEETLKSFQGTTEYFDVDGIPVKFVYNDEGTDFTAYSFMKGKWAVNRVPTNFELDGYLISEKKFLKLVKKRSRGG